MPTLFMYEQNIIGKLKIYFVVAFIAFAIFLTLPAKIFASDTDGTIDLNFGYAWSNAVGWINFAATKGEVHVTDAGLSGYAWSNRNGWINLNPLHGGVKNNAEGVLSGDAWGQSLGWIDFNGVTINTTGDFLGFATVVSDGSKINFNCINDNLCSAGNGNFKVKTDWRPASSRVPPNPGGGGNGGGSGGGTTYGCKDPTALNYNYFSTSKPSLCIYKTTPNQPTTPTGQPTVPTNQTNPTNPPKNSHGLSLGNVLNSFYNYISNLLGFNKQPLAVVEIPQNAPVAFQTLWNLLPVQAIHDFVFAPLPYEIKSLAMKFPELGKTFKDLGVERLTDDVNKLSGVSLNIPNLTNEAGKMTTNLTTGKIALVPGLPIGNFTLAEKQKIPGEFVFPRTGGEKIDLNVALLVGSNGDISQQMSSIQGSMLHLVVKPIGPAKDVTGYFMFESAAPKVEAQIPRSAFAATALLGLNNLVQNVTQTTPVEQDLVLSSFQYSDPDHDGIYTADVASPGVPGTYEIVTVINYIDPTLGSRLMRLIDVVDPEGYIYEQNGNKETRIPSAIVSLYTLNNTTKKYELWQAKDFQQDNPQITDVRGTYSFMVPPGSYYFTVEAPGYDAYQGKAFVVAEGGGIHQNIELTPSGRGWLSFFDWKTILLIVVLLLLVYNFYHERTLEKLLKYSKKS
jgi:hypothetical protein